MKKLILLAILPLMFALVGCNTMKGFGEDLQKAGEKIEGAAKK
jgi:predicted small secreted protein